MQEIFCYNISVKPKNFEKKEESIAMKIEPSIKREIEEIAFADSRTVSAVAGALMIRGLALYRRDGKLRDEGLPSGVFVATLNEPKSKLAAHPSSKEVVHGRLMNDAEAAEAARRLKPRKRKAR